MKTPKATSTKNQLSTSFNVSCNVDEIKNCVILYLSNDACAKALKHGIFMTIETNPPRCKLLPN